MNQKTFLSVSGVVFLIVSLLHLIRAIAGWSITIETWSIPPYLSLVAFFVAGYLSYTAFSLSKK